jgi:hypothetical protein
LVGLLVDSKQLVKGPKGNFYTLFIVLARTSSAVVCIITMVLKVLSANSAAQLLCT